MEILNNEQLKRLKLHKYSATGSSLLEPYFQIYWRWLVELFPMWLAPNTITVVGLLINAITSLLLILYCPSATESAPSWVYAINGIGLFIYQSLDAIDGKQARRTGSSTPLGELFDHGCDSISTVLVALAFAITIKVGNYPWVMTFMCLSSYFTFYFGHWSAYVTGTLQFGLFDVTEVQVTTYIGFLVTAYFGPEMWGLNLPVLNWPLQFVMAGVLAAGCIITYIRFIKVVMKGGCGVNGSTVANTSVLSPFVNIGVVMALACCIASQSKSQILQKYPVLYLFFIGIIAAKVTNRIIVAHMSRSELVVLDSSLIGPSILMLNQYFGTVLNETLLLALCFIYSIFDLSHYMYVTYNQIANHLNVWIFSLEPRKSTEKES